MTPGALVLARDGDDSATEAASALWTAITGEVSANPAGAALDAVSAHLGASTDVPDATLREAVIRCGLYLHNSRPSLGFHGGLGDGLPDADPRVAGYSALRRSGAMGLLAPWSKPDAGVF